jgi:hypothetical protein
LSAGAGTKEHECVGEFEKREQELNAVFLDQRRKDFLILAQRAETPNHIPLCACRACARVSDREAIRVCDGRTSSVRLISSFAGGASVAGSSCAVALSVSTDFPFASAAAAAAASTSTSAGPDDGDADGSLADLADQRSPSFRRRKKRAGKSVPMAKSPVSPSMKIANRP